MNYYVQLLIGIFLFAGSLVVTWLTDIPVFIFFFAFPLLFGRRSSSQVTNYSLVSDPLAKYCGFCGKPRMMNWEHCQFCGQKY